MYYTDNPLSDFYLTDAEQERKLEALPRCADCGEPIQDEYCYLIKNTVICTECLESNYRMATDGV